MDVAEQPAVVRQREDVEYHVWLHAVPRRLKAYARQRFAFAVGNHDGAAMAEAGLALACRQALEFDVWLKLYQLLFNQRLRDGLCGRHEVQCAAVGHGLRAMSHWRHIFQCVPDYPLGAITEP
jgi:hypothetical protein